MTKKEIKEKVKNFQKTAEENTNELKILNILSPELPQQESIFKSQDYIQKNVNLYTKDKVYSLKLDNGPYKTKYTNNRSHILAYNNNGYISSFNSQNFNLCFETNIEDHIYDARYLHNECFIATAQKDCVFVYDNTGSELHAIRVMKATKMLEFLPYHFLLAGTTTNGFLNYFDTSIGEMNSSIFIKDKEPTIMKQNQSNAIIHIGSKTGKVSLWSPAQKDFLMKINCHKSAISTNEMDRSGVNMVTTGMDNKINVFDIRNTYSPLKSIKTKANIHVSALSQRNLLAIAYSNKITVLKNFENVYLKYSAPSIVSSLEFCNFEDILSIGHNNGLCSIVVPGSGDPIYDSNEVSPFTTVKQRQNTEVKQLLQKIPSDLISLKPILGEFEKPNKLKMPNETGRYFDSNEPRSDALSRFKRKNFD